MTATRVPQVRCCWEKKGSLVARVLDRVPDGVSRWAHTRVCLDAIADRLADMRVPMDRTRAEVQVIAAPPGRPAGTYLSVAYPYKSTTPEQNQAGQHAYIEGWGNGSLIRQYAVDGTPEELRTIPALLCSPHSPLLDHADPGLAWMLHHWWMRGLTAGRAGKPSPQAVPVRRAS